MSSILSATESVQAEQRLRQLRSVLTSRERRLAGEQAALRRHRVELEGEMEAHAKAEALLAAQWSKWQQSWSQWASGNGALADMGALRQDRELLKQMRALAKTQHEALQTRWQQWQSEQRAWQRRAHSVQVLRQSLDDRAQRLSMQRGRAAERRQEEAVGGL